MKIAILSDIHGNLTALNSVMDDIQKNKCDKTFFLGDYVLAGPEPAATIDYCMHISTYDNTEMIQGNTDKMIVEYSDEIFNSLQENGAPIMANALKDDVSILNDTQKEFLKNLPAQKEIEIEGVKLLLVHGSPRRNNEDILPDTPPKEVEEMVKDTDATIILCGHTHIPCGFQTVTRKTVINVGSVGRPFTEQPKSCYLILDINDGKFTIEHKFVRYDNKKAADILSQRTFEGADKLSQVLINPTERHF